MFDRLDKISLFVIQFNVIFSAASLDSTKNIFYKFATNSQMRPFFVYSPIALIKNNQFNCSFIKRSITVVPEMIVLDKQCNFCNHEGYFTTETIPLFLAYLAKEKKINNDDFLDASSITADNLAGIVSGGQTAQIFLITIHSTHTQYILRETATQTELIRLKMATLINELVQLSVVSPCQKVPVIAFPEHFLTYIHNNKSHHIFIMTYIAGSTLAKIITTYIKSGFYTSNLRNLGMTFGLVGAALAYFHQYFMDYNTNLFLAVPHGDFTLNNIIIYNNQVYFIDNEQIILHFFNRHEPFYDISRIFTFSLISHLENSAVSYTTMNYILSLTLKSFLHSYIEAYSQELRNIIFDKV